MKTFYLSCSKEEVIREQGYGPLVSFMRDTFSAYLDPHASTEGDLTNIVIGKGSKLIKKKHVRVRI